MKGLIRAWTDMDAATPAQRVLVLVALVGLFIAAGIEWT